MSIKVKKNKVLTGGREYKAGEIIPGLETNEERRLVSLGVCEWAPDFENVSDKVDGQNNEGGQSSITGGSDLVNGDQLPLKGLILTVEDFAELKADEQKAHLKALKIEPAGKEEERVAQYEEWYADQVAAADNN